MMKLEVSGNTSFYQTTLKVVEESMNLTGTITLDYYSSNVRISNNSRSLKELTFNELNRLANEIRGCDYDKIVDILESFEISIIKEEISTQKKDLIKAFFNIIIWIEYAFAMPNELNIESNIYDEFVIDYSGKPESQKDIYFLPKEYLSKVPLLTHLMKINLLCKLKVELGNQKYISYFIPFVKPGTNIELFKNENQNYHPEWLKILNLRDGRIKSWFKNR